MKIRILETQEFKIKIKETSAISELQKSIFKTKTAWVWFFCSGKNPFHIYAHLKLRKMNATCKEF